MLCRELRKQQRRVKECEVRLNRKSVVLLLWEGGGKESREAGRFKYWEGLR